MIKLITFIAALIIRTIFLLVDLIIRAIALLLDLLINIKNNIITLISNLIKIFNNRLNQDCLGKRVFRITLNKINDLKIYSYLKGKIKNFIPLIITFITAKLYLLITLNFSVLNLISISKILSFLLFKLIISKFNIN